MMIDRVLSFRIKEDLKRLFNWLIIGLLFVCLFVFGSLLANTCTTISYAITATFLFSSQNFTSSDYPNCPSASCIFINYNSTDTFRKNLQYLHIYNVVAFLWCVNFVIALGQCTLAGAFASYYWAFEKPADIPMFPLFGGFIRSLR